MADSPVSTPKRKRIEIGDIPVLNTTNFLFDIHSPLEDGSASPRSKVAHRFRGLALEGGGGVGGDASLEPRSIDDAIDDEAVRKRARLPANEMKDVGFFSPAESVAQAPADLFSGTGSSQLSQWHGRESISANQREFKLLPSTALAIDPNLLTQSAPPAEISGDAVAEPGFSTSGVASNDSESHHSRQPRAGTPPLTFDSNPASVAPIDSDTRDDSAATTLMITDPVRASLTWHEDEITVYDPDDSDDDGTGINGIGFKPTPAIAYARTVRRKQQLAEYRKREEREARARRSQRRRGNSPAGTMADAKNNMERRRVRFLEGATQLMVRDER